MTAPSFDLQAETFDRRAGLPAAAVAAVAAALSEWTPEGRVLEIGAGTGQIGEAIPRDRYVGIDLSLALLAVARRRDDRDRYNETPLRLVRADAEQPWPVRDRAARVIFVSRTAHLLDTDRFAAEVARVAEPSGFLLLGRVERADGSARRLLQRALRGFLAEHGVEARQGATGHRRAIAAIVTRGGRALPPRAVASWSAPERPLDVIESWRGKPGLAGRAIPSNLQHQVLDRLEAWAREHLGPLDAARASLATYEITSVQLPAENR